MRKPRLLLILCSLFFSQWSQGQNSNQVIYDTLPRVLHLNQQFFLLDEFRCVAYLFAQNFTVKDSLGNIYVALYYDKDNHETVPPQLLITSNMIFNVAYPFIIDQHFEYLKETYRSIIVLSYDKEGKLIHFKDYAIRKYRIKDPRNLMKNILEQIRIPNTWGIKEDTYQIVYYCMQPAEKKKFWKYLLLILNRLKLLDKKYSTWQEYYPGCTDQEACDNATIKLSE